MVAVELPAPFSSIPREQLLYSHLSPIEPLQRLTLELGNADEARTTKFWIKREDNNSGLANGGNKTRKLEYVLPDALSAGATTLVTTGGLQSNHMRQVSATAARYGLKAYLLPKDRVDSKDAEYRSLGNIQINHLLGAENAPLDAKIEEVMEKLKSNGEVPYWIPSGASTHPLGGCGYARCAFEIAKQEEELNVYFDTIYVPSASGSTLGGLIAGFKLLEKNISQTRDHARKQRRLIGICALPSAPGQVAATILEIAKTTATKIGLSDSEITPEDVNVDERWHAGAYGYVDDWTADSIKLLAQSEGILTDPVYTGKALAGMIGMAQKGELKGSKNVLFVHTGGVPSLSAYPNVR